MLGIQTIIQWEQGLLAKGDTHGFLVWCQHRGTRLFWLHGRIVYMGARLPLCDRLLVHIVAFGQSVQALLTLLECPTHRRRRCGAPMQYLSHSSSFGGSAV